MIPNFNPLQFLPSPRQAWAKIKSGLRRLFGYRSAREMEASAPPPLATPPKPKPPTPPVLLLLVALALAGACASVDGARAVVTRDGALDLLVDMDGLGPSQLGVIVSPGGVRVCVAATSPWVVPECRDVPVEQEP